MQPTQIQMKGDYLVYIRSGVHFFSPNLSVDPLNTPNSLEFSSWECPDMNALMSSPKPDLPHIPTSESS